MNLKNKLKTTKNFYPLEEINETGFEKIVAEVSGLLEDDTFISQVKEDSKSLLSENFLKLLLMVYFFDSSNSTLAKNNEIVKNENTSIFHNKARRNLDILLYS